MTDEVVKPLSRAQKFKLEGRCARCGVFSYPYYLCHDHRIMQNILTGIREFEKRGWFDVTRDSKNKKIYKWNHTAPPGINNTKVSPKRLAELALPRMNGRPMTEKVLIECITEVLEVKQYPLTKKEINNGIKAMKTIGKVLPEREEMIEEYKLIQRKESKLSKSQRDAVEFRISFLLKRGVITSESLITVNV